MSDGPPKTHTPSFGRGKFIPADMTFYAIEENQLNTLSSKTVQAREAESRAHLWAGMAIPVLLDAIFSWTGFGRYFAVALTALLVINAWFRYKDYKTAQNDADSIQKEIRKKSAETAVMIEFKLVDAGDSSN